MRRGALVLAIALAVAPLAARAAVGGPSVQVRNNFYDPQQLHIAVGQTVTWNVIDGGHTVTAEDGRFDQTSLLQAGDTIEYTFTQNETVRYFCRVHTGSMFGVIIVGEGSPPPPPPPTPEVRTVTPDPGGTPIADALRDAPPNTIIELAPDDSGAGVYPEHVVVTTPGIVLRGTGAESSDIVIDGDGTRDVGISIGASGVHVEHLTVAGHTNAGIFAAGAPGFRIDDVITERNARYGIRAEGSPYGTITGVRASDANTAGISIARCRECDTLIEDVEAHDNLTGIESFNGGAIVVRHSTIHDNGTGIALKSVIEENGALYEDAPQRGSHLYANTITDNTRTDIAGPSLTEALAIATGAGVWINGAMFARVEGNTITGHTYGVAVTGLIVPALADRIIGNTIGESTDADLAWDGLGANVCFDGNAITTSLPPEAQTLYACSLPVTVGVPFPIVDVTILRNAQL